MWPFTKKQKTSSIQSIDSIPTTDDPDISCFARGLGRMIDSPSYKWEHSISHTNVSHCVCLTEKFYVLIDYNRYSEKYGVYPELGGLTEKEQKYILEKLINRFKYTTVQKIEGSKNELIKRIDSIKKIGCPESK